MAGGAQAGRSSAAHVGSPARPPSTRRPTSPATSRGSPGSPTPTSPSCPRAGRAELTAVPGALPGGQVLHFLSPPAVLWVATPAPRPPAPQSLLSCVPFESREGRGDSRPGDASPGGKAVLVDLSDFLPGLGEVRAPRTPPGQGWSWRGEQGGSPVRWRETVVLGVDNLGVLRQVSRADQGRPPVAADAVARGRDRLDSTP